MYCPKCGKELPDDSQFCLKCGRALVADVPKTTPKTKPSDGLRTRVIFFVVGILFALIAVYPMLKLTMREQNWGLLMTPEDVKLSCGTPQADEIYKLTYVVGDSRVELQFMGANHRWFLRHVKWGSSDGGGDINQVSRDLISQYVKSGQLPQCLEAAAQ